MTDGDRHAQLGGRDDQGVVRVEARLAFGLDHLRAAVEAAGRPEAGAVAAGLTQIELIENDLRAQVRLEILRQPFRETAGLPRSWPHVTPTTRP